MAYEQAELSGSLFRNERKQADNHPDYTGSIKINGKVWRLAGWKKADRNGKGFLSLKVSEPQAPQTKPKPLPKISDGYEESEF